jgi:DNA topoisomerase-1
MDTITADEALKLFEMPRQLGENAEGEKISVGIGRFGPFVKAGSTYASIPATLDPWEIDLPTAIEVVRAKREAAANKVITSFQDGAIQVLRGKFGPYITDGAKNGRIPKDVEPESLTEADCVAILAAAPAKGSGKGRFGRKGGKVEAPRKTKTVSEKPAKAAAVKKAAPKKAGEKPAAKKTAAKKATVKKAATRKPAATKAKAPVRKSA